MIELPEPLQNPCHEAFAVAYSRSGNASAAWREATGKSANADVNGPKWLGKVGMAARIAVLRSEADRQSKFTKEEALKFLADVIRAKPEDAKATSSLCETRMSKTGPFYAFPDKLGALKVLGSWCGWETGTEADNQSAAAQRELVDAVRSLTHGRKRPAS